ncbi:MAG: hypothetical protein IPG78_09080 [Ignavibacteria bacterium]|nr:hypothetical protein [Ignavibacteria bacterium]
MKSKVLVHIRLSSIVVRQGSSLTSGVYFYRLTSDDFSDTKRMVLIK